jgi:2-dehydro-3-deoxygluconokinase
MGGTVVRKILASAREAVKVAARAGRRSRIRRVSLDVLAFGEPLLRLQPPAGGRLEEAVHVDLWVGGAELNTCCALAALGLRAALFSRVPEGPLGRRVRRHLRAAGVDDTLLAEAPGRLGLYWTEYGPAPRSIEVVYDRGDSAFSLVEPADAPWEALESARLFYTTGITAALGAAPRRTALEMARRARAAGVTVAVDLNYRARLWPAAEAAPVLDTLAGLAHVLFATSDDLRVLYGLEDGPEEAAAAARARFGARTVVVTCGAEGAAACDDQGTRRAPVLAAASVDRVGAGDAFSAGYLWALLGGRPQRALEYALALAALKHTLPGDALATTPEELDRIAARAQGDIRR